jgi:hypothetical protein
MKSDAQLRKDIEDELARVSMQPLLALPLRTVSSLSPGMWLVTQEK